MNKAKFMKEEKGKSSKKYLMSSTIKSSNTHSDFDYKTEEKIEYNESTGCPNKVKFRISALYSFSCSL